MSIVSLVGVVVLLGLTWLLSYDKKAIPFRIIFWGIGLQFVFALIILRQDIWSFVGMFILASLITVYQLKDGKYLKLSVLVAPLILIFCYVNDYTGQVIFQGFSDRVSSFLSLSDYGAKFLFGNLADNKYFGPWANDFPNAGTWPGFGFQFGFKVLPTILFL